jgi:hypothetical protein
MRISRRTLLATSATAILRGQEHTWRARELRRFKAPEANQAVAVDAHHFYAIGNHVIGKYDKKSGQRVAGWECENAKPLIHLDSGVVHQGVLYCAHSNYPDVPMTSSIEMWDTKTMRHSGSHSFGMDAGSLTWVDFYQGRRYLVFGNYRGRGGEPNRDPRYTTLMECDAQWRRVQAWIFPKEVIAKLGNFSISGGTFGPDGRLFCCGHDEREIYVLTFPSGGSTLQLEAAFPTPNPGQGIAFDRSEPWIMYSIERASREVIVADVQGSPRMQGEGR